MGYCCAWFKDESLDYIGPSVILGGSNMGLLRIQLARSMVAARWGYCPYSSLDPGWQQDGATAYTACSIHGGSKMGATAHTASSIHGGSKMGLLHIQLARSMEAARWGYCTYSSLDPWWQQDGATAHTARSIHGDSKMGLLPIQHARSMVAARWGYCTYSSLDDETLKTNL